MENMNQGDLERTDSMLFYTDPNFVVMAFNCPYCNSDTTITVHEDGATSCNHCGAEARPPMCYEEALKLSCLSIEERFVH